MNLVLNQYTINKTFNMVIVAATEKLNRIIIKPKDCLINNEEFLKRNKKSNKIDSSCIRTKREMNEAINEIANIVRESEYDLFSIDIDNEYGEIIIYFYTVQIEQNKGLYLYSLVNAYEEIGPCYDYKQLFLDKHFYSISENNINLLIKKIQNNLKDYLYDEIVFEPNKEVDVSEIIKYADVARLDDTL